MYKLCCYVPASHLESVKQALFGAGAGKYENYDRCCWQVRGEGQFRPLSGSQPFLGESGNLETVEEYKVEMICQQHLIKPVLQALQAAHPYEEPAYDVTQIVTLADI